MSRVKHAIAMNYICNAFSLAMVAASNYTLHISEVDSFPADCRSYVGHPDTAKVLGVEYHRGNLRLEKGDVLYVAQLQGGRLPEGSTTLPKGFSFKFYKVELD